MKKYISIILTIVLIIAGLFVLTGCTDKENNSNNAKIDLTLDLEHVNNTKYNAKVGISDNDKVTEFDEEEPNFARIENEKDNYVLDITLDAESKEAYEQFKTSAKENDLYEETKFGKYDGYYSDDDGIYGYVLLDTTDPTFNIFLNFYVYLFDESAENNDIKAIYESSKIQNILNNIEF